MKPNLVPLVALAACFPIGQLSAQSAGQTATAQVPDQTGNALYTFATDARPEIRAVAGVIDAALANYKNAGNDADQKKQALLLLRPDSQGERIARALAPQAAVSQILNSAQAQNSAAAALDAARPDKQAAAPSKSSGSTQLVEKAGATSLIALAVDSGALSQTQTGTTTTLSGSLYGMYAAFATPSDMICAPGNTKGSCGWYGTVLRNTDLSASFNLAQASTKTTTATQPAGGGSTVPAGTAVTVPSSVGKLSAVSAKFALLNRFNPTSTGFRDRWNGALQTFAPELKTATSTYLDAVQKFSSDLALGGTGGTATSQEDSFVSALDGDARALLQTNGNDQAAARKKLADDLDTYYQAAIQAALKKDSSFYDAVTSLVTASNALRQLNNEVIAQALGNMFSLAYDYVRTPQQPDMHNVTFIWGNAPKSSTAAATGDTPSLFSANLGISVYGGSIPSGAKYGRMHYGQAAAEFDFPFNLNSSTKNATFTVAAYWQYQPSPSVLTITQANVAPGTTIPAPTQVLVGTAGNLFVAQAKISLKAGKSGVNVPLGLKWSNKTDLLSGNKYAGQFGISYDFSSLSSILGGNQ